MPESRRPDLATLTMRLEQALRAQLELHGHLESCLRRKREAIRAAQIGALTELCASENTLIQRLAELEKARLALVGQITQLLEPSARTPLSLERIAGHLPPAEGERLRRVRADLRERCMHLKRESSIIRAAMEALNRHMIGVLQTVRSALSGAGVYERKGQVALGAQLDFSVDVRS